MAAISGQFKVLNTLVVNKSMKQIKTVICPIYEPVSFDKKINGLLAAGWYMKKRTLISINGEPNEVGSAPVIQALYAEFEKHVPPFPEEITM